jgi:DNA invertase Pin-like site-specific DNA recombinase
MTEAGSKGPALIYCRVSTKALAEGTSLESQRERCAAHAERLGYTVARVTQEIHTGAELFERPKLSTDRADIRDGEFKALIAYSVDRLTRSEAHLCILSAECEASGCELVFVTNSEDAPREAYAAEVEHRRAAERIRRGHHYKLTQGRAVFTGWPLYGYRPDKGAGVHRVFEPEAAVVRRIFRMCAEGKGMHSIASTLNGEGVPSPKSHIRPGSKWTSGGISYLLANRSYMGDEVCWKTRKTAKKRDRPRHESEWVRLPEGTRPPIVSPEVWEACRGKVRARADRLKNLHEHPALLRGHIFCAECGAGMVRNHFRRGKYEYLKYRCGSRWRPFATDCRGEGVPLLAAHEWAWRVVKGILSNPAPAGRGVGAPRETPPDLAAARRAREAASGALRVFVSNFPADPLLRPYADEYTARAGRDIAQLDSIIGELERREAEFRRRDSDLLDLCRRAKDGADEFTFEERRSVIAALGFKAYANGDDPARWRYEVDVAEENNL